MSVSEPKEPPKTAAEWEDYLVHALTIVVGKAEVITSHHEYTLTPEFQVLATSVRAALEGYQSARAEFRDALGSVLNHLATQAAAMKKEREGQ